MGSCVSVYKTSQPAVASKADAVPFESQRKDKVLPVASFHDVSNSKDDIFFDPQAYLESDCDDFVSVNGDLTPLHGASPLHGLHALEHEESSCVVDDNALHHSALEPSPSNKKRLVELFHEGDSGGISEATPNRTALERLRSLAGAAHCCLPVTAQSQWKKKKARSAMALSEG